MIYRFPKAPAPLQSASDPPVSGILISPARPKLRAAGVAAQCQIPLVLKRVTCVMRRFLPWAGS
jgi:hypothetical protein